MVKVVKVKGENKLQLKPYDKYFKNYINSEF